MLRGIKTLHLRVERSCKNARKVAKYLAAHPKVGKVYYPGLKESSAARAGQEADEGLSGLWSPLTSTSGTFEMAQKVLANTEMFTLAESLGGVESLIGHPASMTHASIPKQERLKVGLTDSLIRLSIGMSKTPMT
jgi:cystathionine beta-lyase/cystathionine gamma-synthase